MALKTFGRVMTRTGTGLLAMALTAPVAGASELELSMSRGRVTIRAQDTLITDILAEWGRIGNTAIIDIDKLADESVTLELVDVPEAQALRTLLRTASGYLAAPRPAASDGASRFDRILILATSKPAARVATVASPGRALGVAPRAGATGGQRLGVVPNAPRGRTPFTVSAAQQEQLDQLQQLLQSSDSDPEPPSPIAAQPAFGDVPTDRPGMPMTGTAGQETAGVQTGAFGATQATGGFGSTVTSTSESGRTQGTTIRRP